MSSLLFDWNLPCNTQSARKPLSSGRGQTQRLHMFTQNLFFIIWVYDQVVRICTFARVSFSNFSLILLNKIQAKTLQCYCFHFFAVKKQIRFQQQTLCPFQQVQTLSFSLIAFQCDFTSSPYLQVSLIILFTCELIHLLKSQIGFLPWRIMRVVLLINKVRQNLLPQLVFHLFSKNSCDSVWEFCIHPASILTSACSFQG